MGRDAGRGALTGLVNGLIAQLEPDRAVTFTDARQAGEHLAAVLAKGPFCAGFLSLGCLDFRCCSAANLPFSSGEIIRRVPLL